MYKKRAYIDYPNSRTGVKGIYRRFANGGDPKDKDKDKNKNPYKEVDSTKADIIRAILPVPKNAAQMISKVLFKDARMSNSSISDEEKMIVWDVIQNAQKRSGKKSGGGTEYQDYGDMGYGDSEQFHQWFNRGSSDTKELIKNSLTNPGYKIASTIGRGRYWQDEEDPDIMYYTDVYDWNPSEKNFSGNNVYQKLRNFVRSTEDKDLNEDKNENYRMNFKLDRKEIEDIRQRIKPDQTPQLKYGGNPDEMRTRKTISYNIPKHGFGALLAKNVSEQAVQGFGSAAGMVGQMGRPSGAKGFLSGAGTGAMLGAKLGTIVPGVGNVIGAIGGGLAGGIAGLIGGRKKRRKLDASLEDDQDALAEQRFEENEARLELQRSKGVLEQYPTEGVQGVNYFGKTFGYGGNMYGKRKLKKYGVGGSPDYLAEGGETVEFEGGNIPSVHGQGQLDPVSQNMAEIEGPNHSSPTGGVPMSGGDRIYSDRLYPSPDLKGVLKSLGIRSNGTYADIASRIGKKESKHDAALVSDDRFEKTRGEKMKEKYSLAKELVFADQEATKPMEEEEVVDMTGMQEEFAYGGKLPKYQDGGRTKFHEGWEDALSFKPRNFDNWGLDQGVSRMLQQDPYNEYGSTDFSKGWEDALQFSPRQFDNWGLDNGVSNRLKQAPPADNSYRFTGKPYDEMGLRGRGPFDIVNQENIPESSYRFKPKPYNEWEDILRGKNKPSRVLSSIPFSNPAPSPSRAGIINANRMDTSPSSPGGSGGGRGGNSVPTPSSRYQPEPAINYNKTPLGINTTQTQQSINDSAKKQFEQNLVSRGPEGTPREGLASRIGGFLGNNLGMIAAGANYFMNERQIDQMPLTQKTRMFDPVFLDDSRRDQYQQHRIGQSARQGMRAIQAGSTQTRNASVGDIVSRSMEASNQVADTETQRVDAIRRANAGISNQAGQYNTELANQTYGDYQVNRMLQLSERMKNRNNLTASILGNLQVRKMNELDKMRMRLVSERDKERGIIGRSENFQDILDTIYKKVGG